MYEVCISPVFSMSVIVKHVKKIKLSLWVGKQFKMCYISVIRENKLQNLYRK